jgi:hypothetical protein
MKSWIAAAIIALAAASAHAQTTNPAIYVNGVPSSQLTLQFSSIPSGVTIPSPVISNPSISNATFTGNTIAPLIAGGTAANSNLTLESTTGAGTTDYISFKTGSQLQRLKIDTNGYIYVGSAVNYGSLFNIQYTPPASMAPSSLYFTPLGGLLLISDAVGETSIGGAGQNVPVGYYMQHQYGGATVNNGRYGLLMTFQQTATTSATNNFRFYVGISSAATSLANDTGTAVTPAGNLEGMTSGCWLSSVATYWNTCLGLEVGAAIQPGGSSYTRAAILTDSGAMTGGTYGTYADAHILSWAAAVGGSFQDWARLDSYAGAAPVTGTVIHAVGSWTITNGIDFNSLTISGNAFQWGGGAYYLSGAGAASFSNLTVISTGYPYVQSNTLGPFSVITTSTGAATVPFNSHPAAGALYDSMASAFYLTDTSGNNYEAALYSAVQLNATAGAHAAELIWYTANANVLAQRMQLSAAGGLSIGSATDPGATNLLVAGKAFLAGSPSGALASFYACFDTLSAPVGEITYQAGNCTTSLRETKHGIEAYPPAQALSDTLALKPSTFIMNSGSDGRRQIGLIAQDVELEQPLLAGYVDNRLKTVQYDRTGVLAIGAIQELYAELTTLRREVASLRAARLN